MTPRLMHPDTGWAEGPAITRRFRTFRLGPPARRLPHEEAMAHDLALETLVDAMGATDAHVTEVARAALLSATHNDAATIHFRQRVLADSMANTEVVRQMHLIAVRAVGVRSYSLSEYLRYPGTLLTSALERMSGYIDCLHELRQLAVANASRFQSHGMSRLLRTITDDYDPGYEATLRGLLEQLQCAGGVAMSARLGPGNEGIDYVLHPSESSRRRWRDRILTRREPGFSFVVHERDEAGARALGDLRDRGVATVAPTVARAADQMRGFFEALRAELAFYVGCLNLHDALARVNAPVCFPEIAEPGTRALHADGLYDPGLALRVGHAVVGNSFSADGKMAIIVTGANQGGKSTFLRSVGLACVMAQAGIFVAAGAMALEPSRGLFTHYRVEEDVAMVSGKFDEEVTRFSAVVDYLAAGSLILFNESFASTNEFEGSEVARQVVQALVENGVRVVFVTHLFKFASDWVASHGDDSLFLRAERLPDGRRTFRLAAGAPLPTSYGVDLYDKTLQGSR